MLTVHMRDPNSNEGKVTAALAYEREGADGKRLVAAPMSVANISGILPDNVAFKRGEREVKGTNRLRVLLEDQVPCPMAYDSVEGTYVGPHGYVKCHTVFELPFTQALETGSSNQLIIAQRIALDSLIRIHVASLMPRLVTTGSANAKMTGFETAVALSDAVHVDSPLIRAMHGLQPYGESQVLGTADSTVE